MREMTAASRADLSVPPGVLVPVIDDVRRVAAFLWERGWAERNAGNVSVDVTDAFRADASSGTGTDASGDAADRDPTARWFLASAAGSRFRDVARQPAAGLGIVRTVEGSDALEVVWAGSGAAFRPTSEMPAHRLAHQVVRDRGWRRTVVLHTHPTFLIALNHTALGGDDGWLSRALWSVLPEVKVFLPEGVAVVPYRLPGSRALAEATAAALSRSRVVVWDKHGCIVAERDVQEAFDLVDVLDKAARIHLSCLAIGQHPRGLSDTELAELEVLASNVPSGS
jgi:rhamnulose-1-phosphate aldolase